MKKSDINPLPEYFERYINQVEDLELLEAFDESIRQITELDKNLLERIGGKKYAPDKWTVREILQHIIDWERILAQRTLLYARREGSIPPNVDENLLAQNMNAERRELNSLIDELLLARFSTRAMFAGFDDETLPVRGINRQSEISVLAMGFTIIGHQKHHLKMIENNYYPLINL